MAVICVGCESMDCIQMDLYVVVKDSCNHGSASIEEVVIVDQLSEWHSL
jgi:hypothetical protein